MSQKTKDPDHDWADKEWSAGDFRNARPPSELPDGVLDAFPRTRGPQKAPRKVPISIRLSPEVVAHFRATGDGWQSRIDEVLKEAIKRS